MLDEEKEKLERQEKARKDLADAVVKGREQKQARSDDAKRKILIGAYLLKKHDNDIKKLVEQNPDIIG
ncbi:mobilization protein [Escherichia coli]|uniref:mobilization protein n=1 Tax=Escherichia coli TaxID=562 RepID=UPI0012FE2EA4|nr:mobilization protein [Escherichia coli]